MKIKVFINEKNKLMCEIPGDSKQYQFAEFVFGISLLNKDKVIAKFGEEMPELVIECNLDENDSTHKSYIKLIDQANVELDKKYK